MMSNCNDISTAPIAQLGERKTEDLKVTGSIPVRSILMLGDNVILLRVLA